ncbi:MAG: DUF3106 domain-containing protein [Verrucomicrobiota bacterium]
MKNSTTSIFLATLALLGSGSFLLGQGERPADAPPPPPPNFTPPDLPPDLKRPGAPPEPEVGRQANQERMILERFLEMPPEQLARIRQTLERLESMSEEERSELRERARSFRRLDEEKRERMLRHWKSQREEYAQGEAKGRPKRADRFAEDESARPARAEHRRPPAIEIDPETRATLQSFIDTLTPEERLALAQLLREEFREQRGRD